MSNKAADDFAVQMQIATVMAINYEQARVFPTPPAPPVPDETLNFATGKVEVARRSPSWWPYRR